jgi:Tol biopolymer transport system component/DNA-binding winged helix-turn-helix (wHTH) protein
MAVSNSRPGLFRFGIFEVDFESGELWKHGRRVALHDQPLQALALLLEHPGEVVTREQFRQRLWPADTFVDFDKSLNTTISKLRDVLGDSAAHPRFIETLPRRGYRFLSPVEEVSKSKEPRPQPTIARPVVSRSWSWALATVVLILVLVSASYGLRAIRRPDARNIKITPLTTYPGNEQQPSISPDGSQVAFAWDGGPSSHNGIVTKDYDIYRKSLGSEDSIPLTSNPADDLNPIWSPDGQTIAFLRFLSDHSGSLVLVPSGGGAEHILATILVHDKEAANGLAWSPDGRWIVTSDAETIQSPMRLTLISAGTGEKRKLAYDSAIEDDIDASFSPDGKYLAFARHISPVVADIYLMELSRQGEVVSKTQRVTNWNRLNRSPVWTEDGKELLFIGDDARFGYRIWRVPAFKPEEPRLVNEFGEDSSWIALAAGGSRLVYAKRTFDTNIWRLSFPALQTGGRKASAFAPMIATTRLDANPQYSPDGTHIVYQSERSGMAELWVCKSDGSASLQVTHLNTKVSGYPRWSPDGKQIVFHSRPRGYANLFILNVETHAYHQLTSGTFNDFAPSFSHDGRWIYFGSSRKDGHQIWRMPAGGGPAERITRNGGVVPLESVDGKSLFYSKSIGSGLWVLSLDSGRESQFAPSLSYEDTFAVTKRGVYFIHPTADNKPVVSFKSFDSGMVEDLASINSTVGMGLTVSTDEQSILYTQADHSGSDLILVDNLR